MQHQRDQGPVGPPRLPLLQEYGAEFPDPVLGASQSWVPQDIAAASGAGEGTGVLEVGPGIGPLTRELAKRADKVASVELDRSLLPILEETLADFPNAEVCPGDILKTDIPALGVRGIF